MGGAENFVGGAHSWHDSVRHFSGSAKVSVAKTVQQFVLATA